MTSRLYISNAAAGYTPTTLQGDWNQSSGFAAHKLGAKSGAAATSTRAETSGTNNFDIVQDVWVSDAIPANVTINGTVEWVLGLIESDTNANAHVHIHIWVTQGDSDTPRGTLLTDYIGANELPTTATGEGYGAQAVSTVNALAGDRIVIEIGARMENTSTSSKSYTLNYGNTGGTDLTNGSGNTTTEPGWVEFSVNIFVAVSGGFWF